MAKVKIEGNASGTGTFTIAAPNSNTDRTLTLPDEAGTVLTSASNTNFPAGSVLQVVSTAKTDTASYTGSVLSGGAVLMSASITPTSSSNKVLVLVDAKISIVDWSAYIWLARGATKIYMGDSAVSRPRVNSMMEYGTLYDATQASMIYLDSPSTTSSTTYNVYGATSGGAKTIYLNRSVGDRNETEYDGRLASSITLMEIAA